MPQMYTTQRPKKRIKKTRGVEPALSRESPRAYGARAFSISKQRLRLKLKSYDSAQVHTLLTYIFLKFFSA